jgi:hypothetical protein
VERKRKVLKKRRFLSHRVRPALAASVRNFGFAHFLSLADFGPVEFIF